MRFCAFTLVFVLLQTCHSLGQQYAKCSETSKMDVYSNAAFIEEAGDVVGFELAVDRQAKPGIRALLLIYEGTPNKNAVELTGQLTGKGLVLEGNLAEHLVEYPSGKERLQNRPIRIEVSNNGNNLLLGNITIDRNTEPIRLTRTRQI